MGRGGGGGETHLSTTAEFVLAEGERPPAVLGAGGLDMLVALDTSTSSKYDRMLLQVNAHTVCNQHNM